jgi:hypothetical protein
MIIRKDLITMQHLVQIDLKISTSLIKKSLTDYDDNNFIELAVIQGWCFEDPRKTLQHIT